MSQVFRFKKLPESLQQEIADRLRNNGYSDFEAIAKELRAKKYRISKSSLHRISQQLRKDEDFIAAWARKYPNLAAVLVAAIKASPAGGISLNIPAGGKA